jgi:16S rRNA G966 N2-methylase RsmD
VGLLRRQSPGSMQLVFIDPPFESALFESALKAAADVISAQGLVYLEAPRFWTADELAPLGLEIYRSSKAGAVHFHLLARQGALAA